MDSGTLQQSHGGTGVKLNKAGDGKLLIGSTSGDASLQNLTAGNNIAITNGTNSISIAVNGVLPQSHGGTGIDLENGGDGKLLIASGSGAASLQKLTAGKNIAIANGANSIEIVTVVGSSITSIGSNDYPVYWNTSANTLSYYIPGGSGA